MSFIDIASKRYATRKSKDIQVEKDNNMFDDCHQLVKLVSKKYAISSGSACALDKPSHVLQAIGRENYTSNTIRVSIGKYNDESILGLVDEIKEYLDKYTF